MIKSDNGKCEIKGKKLDIMAEFLHIIVMLENELTSEDWLCIQLSLNELIDENKNNKEDSFESYMKDLLNKIL